MTEVKVNFEPVSVLGHLVLDGERQEELTTITIGETAPEPVARQSRPWEGPLGFEAHTTSDKRRLLRGEIGHRDLPLPFRVQPSDVGGHDEAIQAGSIERLEWIPIEEFARAEEFGLEDLPEGSVVIWGEGTLDGSEAAEMAARHIENGAGVSLDITHDRLVVLDADTFAEIPDDKVDLELALAGGYVTGIGGKIAAVTVVDVSAFEEASVRISDGHALVASAVQLKVGPAPRVLVAAGGFQKPPRSAFADPGLNQLTALTIRGRRVFGHLADWTGCHTGFTNVCIPPFDSQTDFAYFHTGEIETEEGDLIPVGKLMFSMEEGIGHAGTTPDVDWRKASEHYDKATSVGAFVRAGRDRFGIWLAGWLRDGLTDAEIQHLRAHPPSGDWRPIQGRGSELVAAFSVAVGGFPIPRALVASAGAEELTIITGPLQVEKPGPRALRRQMVMLSHRRADLVASLEARGLDPDAIDE